ncbi:hypothetical protein JMUB6875_01470 [Nocardia sp. JMUB6875]|uniref:serine/threonine-protein kinase n=1 Tax=Nocardia sp. JMUB6875 TaxID=3158170 RepID=UPI0032E5F2CC
MPTVTPGTTVAGYRIERRLGSGGAGQVFLARHPRLPRYDALKILWRGADPEFRARFLREAELGGRLDHPHVVAIYDCGTDGDMLWIAMQFIDGYDAAELLKKHPGGLPPARAVAIVEGAAEGLDAAHHAGLLHRDVKPANILIEPGGSGVDRVLVTDFGIARDTAETATLTVAGAMVATLAYAAPEQIGDGALDRRTDVYALGCTLYQLLTGAIPFPRETAAAVMHAHLTAPRPRPRKANRAVQRGFDNVIARAMAIDPNHRYDSCGELAAAARAALHGRPVLPPPRSGRGRSARTAAAVTTVAVLAAAALAVVGPGRAVFDTGDHAVPSASVSSTGAADSPWGTYGFVVAAFAHLLPSTPSARGYQGLRCSAANASDNAVALDVAVDHPRLSCSGADDLTVKVTCNADRTARPALDTAAADGNEAWSRKTGTGHLAWRTITANGRPRGRLDVRFDNPAQSFCELLVLGTASGTALHDQWWPTAPIQED